MKRAGIVTAMALGAMMMAGGLAGCERHDEAPKADPRLDGLLPPKKTAPDMNVLENQADLYKKANPTPVATPTPTPASTTPAEGATTEPATGGEGTAPSGETN